MQQAYLMKTASIVGIILIALGIGALAYFATPMQLLVQNVEQQNSNPMIPILGGLALIGGIALVCYSTTQLIPILPCHDPRRSALTWARSAIARNPSKLTFGVKHSPAGYAYANAPRKQGR
jgi:UDP-N-acetylmuramyl pentapeptide phosphotransferase/UDP-N-acetylglucosamine-1-phosphate transferase